MATCESSTNTSKYRLDGNDWSRSDDEVISKIEGIILALKNHEVDAATVLHYMPSGSGNAPSHIFGEDGNHFCKTEVVTAWLSLLVLLASSENVTGQSIASKFIKGCGGCMVYTILMVVACFDNEEVARLVFDFFRYVLGDCRGDVFELREIEQVASLLNEYVPGNKDGITNRCICVRVSILADEADLKTSRGQTAVQLRNIIEGLGALCTSKSFASEMRANSTLTIEVLKKSITDKTFSSEFVHKTWA